MVSTSAVLPTWNVRIFCNVTVHSARGDGGNLLRQALCTLCTAFYIAQCALLTVHYTVHYALHCTVHCVQCTEHSALCTALHCTVMCRLAPVSTTNKVEERSILFALLNCVLQTSCITGILILLVRETHALKSFLFLHCNVFSSLGLILADEV